MARAFVKFFDTSRARRPGFSTSEPWRRAPAAVAIERVATSGLGDARVLNHLSRIGQRSTPDTAPEADAESAWLDLPPGEAPDAMRQLIGRSVTYRIAVGPSSLTALCQLVAYQLAVQPLTFVRRLPVCHSPCVHVAKCKT